MAKKEKHQWRKRLNYKFDHYVAKGYQAQFVILFLVILIIIVAFGLAAGLTSDVFGIGTAIWQSLLHILDPGTISGDETGEVAFVFIMLLVTILGMVFTGTIVGIINNAISDKLEDLKKGHSQIMEKGHVVVIGFDEDIHTILKQVAESNENFKGNKKVVVIDEQGKEAMEQEVMDREMYHESTGETGLFGKKKKNRDNYIFRSGSTVSDKTFAMASVEKARAIIINKDDDFNVIRVLLALVSYLKKNDAYMNEDMPSIVTLMHDRENVLAASIASGIMQGEEVAIHSEYSHKICIMYFEDILARVFAQVCRQPGLSWVVSEIFDYADSEIYIEETDKDGKKLENYFAGKSFGTVATMLNQSIAIGLQKGEEILLNPDPDITFFEKGDKLIHLAVDDYQIAVDQERKSSRLQEEDKYVKDLRPHHFIVFGWSKPLPNVLANIDLYATKGSTVKVLSQKYEELKAQNRHMEVEIPAMEHLQIEHVSKDPYNWAQVRKYLDEEIDWESPLRPTNIVIMCQEGIEKVIADEKVAVLLLNIREYLRRKQLENVINITTEMNLPEDQKLLQHANINDFIVGSEIANKMMVQVAENPHMYMIFDELLNERGSELYLRNMSEYVTKGDLDFTFRDLEEIARSRSKLGEKMQEVAIGYLKVTTEGDRPFVKLNPQGKERDGRFIDVEPDVCKRIENYKLVVLAMERK